MSTPLDAGRLADVLRGGTQSPASFLAEFRRSTDGDVRELLDAADNGDFARVEQLAHRIDGSGRVIGAQPLAMACATLAEASRRGRPAGLRLALDAFLACQRELYASIDTQHPASQQPAAPVSSQPVCAGLVFLVVDDHEFQRSMILRVLRQLGALEVHGFADGASALAAARGLRSHAILVVDLAMPALNGMEVMRIVGEERLPVSIIMNSALADDMLRWPVQAGRSYGATVLGAISKPLTAAKLAPLLAQHRHDQRPAARAPGAPPLAA